MIAMEHTAAAIYVVRNPLDVAISLADHTGETVDGAIAQMAHDTETENSDELVYGRQGSWSSNVASWTRQAHPGLHMMRYEDALADPVTVFGGVARFLGLNPPPRRLEEAIMFSSFESLRAQEDEVGFKERTAHQARFFRSGEAGQWREILSEAQIGRVVEAHRDQMIRFGYLPDGC